MDSRALDIKQFEDMYVGGASNDELCEQAEKIWRRIDEAFKQVQINGDAATVTTIERDFRDFIFVGDAIEKGRGGDPFKGFYDSLSRDGFHHINEDFFHEVSDEYRASESASP